jgi:RNA-directed DNA polymerase
MDSSEGVQLPFRIFLSNNAMTTVRLTGLQHRQIEEQSSSTLQAFQRKIYLKAKQNPHYKFYCLYDKVFRQDTLEEAFKRVRANKGAAGVDGITFQELEGCEEAYIDHIQQELKKKTFQPSPLREVSIPKRKGKTRTIRIPTIKDRTVQMALKLVIEPIFEADFQNNSYGYRPKRSAHDAIRDINRELFPEIYMPKEKRRTIHSIDLKDCFDTIPHGKLLNLIAKRIIDRQLLKLIKAFLKAGIMRERGDNDRGTSQGGVLSPLLANIYLDQIDREWNEKTQESILFRYADDITILLHTNEQHLLAEITRYIEELGLTIHKEKTAERTLKEGFHFLGFTIREKMSRRQKKYLSMEPQKEAIQRAKEAIRTITPMNTPISTECVIERVNQYLRGWQQYFDNIAMGKTRQSIKFFVEHRIMQLITRRHKKKRICYKLFSGRTLYDHYGLMELKSLGRKLTFG